MKQLSIITAAAALGMACIGAQAADWSDTAISVHYGTKFAEPYDPNSITKAIVSITHASGFKYGTNFLNVDFLQSNHQDPGYQTNGGAQEAYGVYRNMLDIGKISGANFKVGPMRGLGLTSGIDLNSKNDSYQSKKRMFVIGPTVEFDVPGFLNLSVLLLDESNDPRGLASRYHYKTHAALEADWGGIAVGTPALIFKGYAQWIAPKGANEFGGATATETHIDTELMYDVGSLAGAGKGTFMLGLEYEFWRNKFGNPYSGFAGSGAFAKTPQVRVEYHF